MNSNGRTRRLVRWVVVVALVLGGMGMLGKELVFGRLHTTSVARRVTVFFNASFRGPIGANSVLIQGDSVALLVDSGLGPLSRRLQRRVARAIGQTRLVVVNTHWHPDHSGGNKRMIQSGATALASSQTRLALSERRIATGLTAPDSKREFEATPPEYLPEVLGSAEVTLDLGGVTATLLNTGAGHTGGDVIVAVDEWRVVAVGDQVWPSAVPFLDLESGGSAAGLLATLDGLRGVVKADAVIIPGHGQPISRDDLSHYVEDVSLAVAWARRASEREKPPARVKAMFTPLVPEETWVRMVLGP